MPPHLLMEKMLKLVEINAPKKAVKGNQTDRTRVSFQMQAEVPKNEPRDNYT